MDAQCVWFLFQRAVETVLRFEVYLSRVQDLYPRKEARLLDFFRDRIKTVKEDLSDHIDRLPRHSIGGTVGEPHARIFASGYALSILTITTWIYELDYLPNQPPVPSGLYIFLGDLFPGCLKEDGRPTVVYHRTYDFEQRTWEPQAEKPGAPSLPVVLRMPYVEFRNPLMWVNLTHEMGHALQAGATSAPLFRDATPDEAKTVKNWASEFFADRVALNVAGSAYLSAFISWYVTRYPNQLTEPSKSHPAPTDRLMAMRNYLEAKELLGPGATFILRVFQQLSENLPQGKSPQPSLPRGMVVGDLATWADSQVEAFPNLMTFGNSERTASEGILESLRDNLVAPSRIPMPTEVGGASRFASVRQQLETEAFDTPERLYEAASQLQEEPNHACEITSAAWEYALTDSLDQFKSIFSRNDLKDGDKWTKYEEYVVAYQRRLRKSIEHAKVHSLWQGDPSDQPHRAHIERPADSASSPSGAPRLRTPRNEPALLTEKQILSRLIRRDKSRIVVTPILDIRNQIQPSSLDLRLGTEFAVVRSPRIRCLDILQGDEKAAEADIVRYLERFHISPEEEFVLHPHDFALGCTLEYIRLPFDIAARLEGKSTWGRLGLQIHSTAGFVDPGFEGALTFELQNVGRVPIPLYPAMRVAQICFYEVEESSISYMKKALTSYGGDPGLVTSKYFRLPDLDNLKRIRDKSKPTHPRSG
jgi:dCTP deaminase